MSEYIDEIIKDLRENPTEWVLSKDCSEISKNGVTLNMFFNRHIPGISIIGINGIGLPILYDDLYNIQKAIDNYKTTYKI